MYLFLSFILEQDLKESLSKECLKGLVGLQVNLAHPEKAMRLKKHDKKKTSEVTHLDYWRIFQSVIFQWEHSDLFSAYACITG